MSNNSEHKPIHPVTRNTVFILIKFFDTNYVDFLVLRVMEIDPAIYVKSYIYCTYTGIVLNFNLSKQAKRQFSFIHLY